MQNENFIETFFEKYEDLEKRGVFMKRELKCLRCGCPMTVGKHLKAKYICPACQKEYVIHGDGRLSVEGQI